MWSLRWHFTNKSVTGHLTVITVTVRHTAGHYGEEYDDWNMQCRLEVAAELQQRWRRTNRRRKSIPRSSSSHREGSVRGQQMSGEGGQMSWIWRRCGRRTGIVDPAVIFIIWLERARNRNSTSSVCVDRRQQTTTTTTRKVHRCQLSPTNGRFDTTVSYCTFMPLTVILIIFISFQSPTHSFIPDLKPPFSANRFHCSLSFSSSALTTWSPRLLLLLLSTSVTF